MSFRCSRIASRTDLYDLAGNKGKMYSFASLFSTFELQLGVGGPGVAPEAQNGRDQG